MPKAPCPAGGGEPPVNDIEGVRKPSRRCRHCVGPTGGPCALQLRTRAWWSLRLAEARGVSFFTAAFRKVSFCSYLGPSCSDRALGLPLSVATAVRASDSGPQGLNEPIPARPCTNIYPPNTAAFLPRRWGAGHLRGVGIHACQKLHHLTSLWAPTRASRKWSPRSPDGPAAVPRLNLRAAATTCSTVKSGTMVRRAAPSWTAGMGRDRGATTRRNTSENHNKKRRNRNKKCTKQDSKLRSQPVPPSFLYPRGQSTGTREFDFRDFRGSTNFQICTPPRPWPPAPMDPMQVWENFHIMSSTSTLEPQLALQATLEPHGPGIGQE